MVDVSRLLILCLKRKGKPLYFLFTLLYVTNVKFIKKSTRIAVEGALVEGGVLVVNYGKHQGLGT